MTTDIPEAKISKYSSIMQEASYCKANSP